MDRLYNEALISRDTLSWTESLNDDKTLALVQLSGRVEASDDLLFKVKKRMAVRVAANLQVEVRTEAWEYHAWVRRTRRDILRYDNAHGSLHKHSFDLLTGRESEAPIATADLPTLDEVIREAIDLRKMIGRLNA